MRHGLSGKLTKKLVENLGPGRHGDGNGLYLVVDPSGARRWIVRVTVKGQKNSKGAPLRTDFGLGGANVWKGEPPLPRQGARIPEDGKAGLEPKVQCSP
ncbi:MAG: Arm DNA-binding domain-containing protein [Paracoccaceae bacterium]